jgi:hypothetical protein
MELQESLSSTKDNLRYQITHPSIVWEFSVEQLDAEIKRLRTELEAKTGLRKMIQEARLGKIE